MSIKNKACLVGAYEHPTRKAEDKSVAQLHAEVAKGALARSFCSSASCGSKPTTVAQPFATSGA